MKNMKFNKRHFIHRLIASPFVFAILIIAHGMFVVKRFYHFLLFGGEYVNFEENEKESVSEIFLMLKEIKENQKKNEISL